MWELRLDLTRAKPEDLARPTMPAARYLHPWVIVLSPDCDLDWDFKARFGTARSTTKVISHVLLCDLEDEAQMVGRIQGSRHKELIKGNRDERFHYLEATNASDTEGLPAFYLDFKRVFSVPTDNVYWLCSNAVAQRQGVLVGPWIQHLADRFTYFLGRVALPEENG